MSRIVFENPKPRRIFYLLLYITIVFFVVFGIFTILVSEPFTEIWHVIVLGFALMVTYVPVTAAVLKNKNPPTNYRWELIDSRIINEYMGEKLIGEYRFKEIGGVTALETSTTDYLDFNSPVYSGRFTPVVFGTSEDGSKLTFSPQEWRSVESILVRMKEEIPRLEIDERFSVGMTFGNQQFLYDKLLSTSLAIIALLVAAAAVFLVTFVLTF